MNDIATNVLKGDPRSIARLITLAENNDPIAVNAMEKIHPKTGNAPLYTKNYSAKEYNALPQNWAIVQDQRGDDSRSTEVERPSGIGIGPEGMGEVT